MQTVAARVGGAGNSTVVVTVTLRSAGSEGGVALRPLHSWREVTDGYARGCEAGASGAIVLNATIAGGGGARLINGTVSVPVPAPGAPAQVLGHFRAHGVGAGVVQAVHSVLFLPAAVNVCFIVNRDDLPLAPFLHVF